MSILLPEQADALKELQECGRLVGADVVVIGAVAYRAWMRDEYRTTEDVDAAVALDLEELSKLTRQLVERGWRQDERLDHRWHSRRAARIDLLPVGTKARQQKQIIWPRAEGRMSLVGFEHVFRETVECELAPGLKRDDC